MGYPGYHHIWIHQKENRIWHDTPGENAAKSQRPAGDGAPGSKRMARISGFSLIIPLTSLRMRSGAGKKDGRWTVMDGTPSKSRLRKNS
jgi:hypothetical protein